MSSTPTPASSSRAHRLDDRAAAAGARSASTRSPSTVGGSSAIDASARDRRARRRRASSSRISRRSPPTRSLSSSGGALGEHAAVVDHRDRVGEPVGLVEVLRGQQHGRALGDEPLDRLPQREPAARVEAGRRLVEEQHRRAWRPAPPRGRGAGACRRSRSSSARLAASTQVEALEQLVRRAAWPRARGSPYRRPTIVRFSRPVRFSSTAAYWPASPIRSRSAAASSTTSRPSTAPFRRRASAASSVCARSWSCRRRSGRAGRAPCRARRRGRRRRGPARRRRLHQAPDGNGRFVIAHHPPPYTPLIDAPQPSTFARGGVQNPGLPRPVTSPKSIEPGSAAADGAVIHILNSRTDSGVTVCSRHARRLDRPLRCGSFP